MDAKDVPKPRHVEFQPGDNLISGLELMGMPPAVGAAIIRLQKYAADNKASFVLMVRVGDNVYAGVSGFACIHEATAAMIEVAKRTSCD